MGEDMTFLPRDQVLNLEGSEQICRAFTELASIKSVLPVVNHCFVTILPSYLINLANYPDWKN